MVIISHTKGVLYAGTNLSLICNISLDYSVDSDVSVDVKWYMESRQLSNTMERFIVLPTINITTSFISNLTLTPLTDEEQGNFTCKARICSNNDFIVDGSENEMTIPISVSQRC